MRWNKKRSVFSRAAAAHSSSVFFFFFFPLIQSRGSWKLATGFQKLDPPPIPIGVPLRLFSIVDTKQKNPLFLFSFFVKPFSIVTQNKKWGQNFYVLGFWNIKRGHNLFQRRGETQNTKLFMGRRGEGWRAAVEGLNGKVIDFNEIFSKTYSFVYFEIFCIVEATYSENMKPMCRFNQLCNFEAAYFSAYLFEIWPDQRVFFFSCFPP